MWPRTTTKPNASPWLLLMKAQGATPPKNTEAIKAFELAALAAENRIDYAEALLRLHSADNFTDRSRDPVEWARGAIRDCRRPE